MVCSFFNGIAIPAVVLSMNPEPVIVHPGQYPMIPIPTVLLPQTDRNRDSNTEPSKSEFSSSLLQSHHHSPNLTPGVCPLLISHRTRHPDPKPTNPAVVQTLNPVDPRKRSKPSPQRPTPRCQSPNRTAGGATILVSSNLICKHLLLINWVSF